MKEERDQHRKQQMPGEGNKEMRKNNKEGKDRGSKERSSNAANDETPIYLTGDSTLQTPEEDRKDKSIDPRKDNTMSVSNDDLHDIKAGRLTGREPREEGGEDEERRK